MKNLDVNEYVVERMRLYHKSVVKDAISIEPYWAFEYLVTFKDGSKKVYDDLYGKFYIFRNTDDLTEEEFREELGRRIKKMMDIRHINQTKMSKIIGVSQATINLYANGKIIPNFYILKKIARALGCDVNDLVW